MIFKSHWLRRITKISLIIFVIFSDFNLRFSEDLPGSALMAKQHPELTEDESISKQLALFFNRLIKAPNDEWYKIFGRYSEIITSELSLDNLYFVSDKEIEYFLEQTASDSIDSLTLFTHPLFQDQQGFAIAFNEQILQQINKNFNFHGLFYISIPSVYDGSAVKMKFFVIGQGKMIVGYNQNAKIKHPDYDFVTGNYDYYELFIMDIKKDSKGNPGLFNIKGISNPNEKPQWMKGPLNVDIHSFILTSDSGGRRQIRVQFDLFGIKHKLLNPIPIEKLSND